MSKNSGKQQILDVISKQGGVATSLDVFGQTSLHQASIDKILKSMVENGELTREKKTPSGGGREVFHYSISAPTHTSAEDEELDEDEDGEYTNEDDWGNGGGYDEDEARANREDADTDISYSPANAVCSPTVVFLIRKDDIEGFTYGSGGHKFAREISQFVKYGSRRFERHGHAVISVFISETPTELITAHMRAALPQITFATTYSINDAIEYIQRYSDEIGKAFYVENFRIFVRNYFDTYAHIVSNQRDSARLVPVTKTEPDQPKKAEEAQPTVNSGDVIQRLANDGTAYQSMTGDELGEVFQKLAQFYIENNW